QSFTIPAGTDEENGDVAGPKFEFRAHALADFGLGTKFCYRHTVINEVDAFRGVIINLGDFSFHQLRVCDHAARVSFPEQRLLEPENFAMFAIKGLEEFLPPAAQFIPPLKPGAVNAIARSINITSPNALQTHEHVALIAHPHFLNLVRESDGRATADASKRAEGPLARRPIVAREEDSLATCFR